MAIIKAFKIWRQYLNSTIYPIKVFTDYKNLTTFTITKVLNKRQIGWAKLMAGFNFIILYIKGNKNGQANTLSK